MEQAIIPFILGITEVFKQAGVPAKYTPVVSVVLGIALLSFISTESGIQIVQGIVYGLSASGLWSGSKAIFTK